MQVPIPNDWNGEDWFCVQVQWPNSPQFIGLLNGLLSIGTRGRFWDEDTGRLTDIQAVFWDIFDRNTPFIACGGDGDDTGDGGDGDGDNDSFPPACAGYFDFEELLMSLCGYNPKAFRWNEDGELEIRDFCGEWVSIGPPPGQGGGDDTIYDPPPDVDPDEQDIYPCGMATAAADMMEDLGGFIWDTADNTLPVFMPVLAQNYIGLDLNNAWTIDAANQALIMKGAVIFSGGALDLERSDVIDSTWSEDLACALFPFMSETGEVDKDDLFNAAKTWILSKYRFSDSGNNIFIQNYWNYVLSAVGKGNLADVARSGMFTNVGDCSCPGGGTGSPSKIWFNGQVNGPNTHTGVVLQNYTVEDSGRRIRFRIAGAASGGRQFTDLEPMLSGAEPGDSITIRMYARNDAPDPLDAQVPANVAGLQTSTIDETQFVTCRFLGTTSHTRSDFLGLGYAEFTSVPEPGDTLTGCDVGEGFMYPDPLPADAQYEFYLEIVAVNGERFSPLGP